jgi:uncharacterized protein YdaU (DUF1376 family)
MAKDPAFLFYPGDWLGGTIGMTFEQKGAYMELLMMQFTRGHMTEHMIRHVIGQNWDILKDKFKQDQSGLWYNERLDLEKERRKNFVDTRKNNISGKNQYTKEPKKLGQKTKHMTSHMENENINENIDNNLNRALDEIYLDQQKPKWPHIDFDFEVNSFKEKVRGSPEHYSNHDSSGLRLAFQSQLRNAKKKFNGTSTKQQQSAGTAEYLKQYYSDKLAGK